MPQPTITSCYDHDKNGIKRVDCLFVKGEPKSIKNQAGDDKMIKFNITCNFPEKLGFCDKVTKNLDITGKIISDVIKFSEPITGGDGVVRLYPQSLVKQFGLATHPEFLPSDINAEFNSNYEYWFEDDVTPINQNQTAFVLLTTHELMHGLGFLSLWDNYLSPTELVPHINYIDAPTPPAIIFNGFFESIFDRFLIVSESGTPLSSFTAELNTFATIGTQFDSSDDFMAKFKASPQYAKATEMLKYSTTPLSLAFLAKGLDFKTIVPDKTANDSLYYLETSLVPYKTGSSGSHVSIDLYEKTSEFIMVYLIRPARGVKDAIKDGGNYVGGAIGPKLKSVFESMGYTTADNLTPEIPTVPDVPVIM
ncbi:3426_t:CDS:2 [Entrophospora sp. SA101]|nr:3426_t:CDS:2 [Entrophospora sp. SA101]CAJ0883609.1 12373_t:CDS:2 [Entrophospora sp. SA101]